MHAARVAGFDVDGDDESILVVELDDTVSERAADVIDSASVAAACSKGWSRLRVVHGSPRLGVESIRSITEARYVRGRSKAAVIRHADSAWNGTVEFGDSGEFTDFIIEPIKKRVEFISNLGLSTS